MWCVEVCEVRVIVVCLRRVEGECSVWRCVR